MSNSHPSLNRLQAGQLFLNMFVKTQWKADYDILRKHSSVLKCSDWYSMGKKKWFWGPYIWEVLYHILEIHSPKVSKSFFFMESHSIYYSMKHRLEVIVLLIWDGGNFRAIHFYQNCPFRTEAPSPTKLGCAKQCKEAWCSRMALWFLCGAAPGAHHLDTK